MKHGDRNMQDFQDIDFNKVWQQTMGWNKFLPDNRQFNDDIERSFWEKLAPKYTDKYNLNKDTTLIHQKLKDIIGYDKTILEIGCGSGNFTVLMACYAKNIIGVDFSLDMLQELKKRISKENLENIRTVNSKWEDYIVKNRVDYIVSVNSLYRIKDIQSTLQKINDTVLTGAVLIRTVQRPLLYPLYKKCNIAVEECLDYELLPLILWRMGIKANVEFVNYTKSRKYDSLAAVELEMQQDLGDVYLKNKKILLDEFRSIAKYVNQYYEIDMLRTTVFIYWKK